MNRATAIATSVLLATMLAACGSDPAKPDAAPAATAGKRIEGVKLTPGVTDIAKTEGKVDLAKDERVRCEKFKPIGSNRVQKRCYTVAEQKATQEANAEEMRKIQTPAPSANGSIGR